MKKMHNNKEFWMPLFILMAVILIRCNVSANTIVSSGTCGEKATYTLDDGGVLSISGQGTVNVYLNDEILEQSVRTVIINDGIEEIGYNAFHSFPNIIYVNISDSVKSINECAFAGCSALENIIIPDNVETIQRWAFSGCKKLKEVEILGNPDIWYQAFSGCDNIEEVTLSESCSMMRLFLDSENVNVKLIDGISEISAEKFEFCKWIGSIEIPSSVKKIGNNAFNDSTLSRITLSENITDIGSGAFAYCTELEDILIPDSITSINSGTFAGCSNLTKIKIPENVQSIGTGAFRECKNLKEINIPENVQSIGERAFSECCNLEEIKIPKNVSNIGESAFEMCSKLKSVFLPDGITCINARTFDSCKNITNINIPSTVTEIGKYAFASCVKLTTLKIPSKVTSIGDGAFSHCERLGTISLPKGISQIGNSTFYNCYYLTNIEIPSTVTMIGARAFAGCDSLISITVPDSVTNIGKYAMGYGTHPIGDADACFKYSDFDIVCNENTAAFEYAINNGIDYNVKNHSWDSGTITKQPTCTKKGVKTFTCINCGKQKNSEIPVVSHVTEIKNKKEASFDTAGYTGDVYCSKCGMLLKKGLVIQKSIIGKPGKVNVRVVKKKVQITYQKVKKASKYQIQYSTKKNFSGVKTKTTKRTTQTISGLKKGKKYYFRVRAVINANRKNYYSGWSKTKTVKVKK